MSVKLEWKIDEAGDDEPDWAPLPADARPGAMPAARHGGVGKNSELLRLSIGSRARWEDPNLYLYVSLLLFGSFLALCYFI